THRDYRRDGHHTLDLEQFVRVLGPRFVVLARSHYLDTAARAAAGRTPHPQVIDVSGHPSVEELCLAS
ncbi:MAG TPA: hypothetical protein DD420_27400, partial [Streptomyces sp.]|nr:hypothetical protein [Streptomyces sp.]